MPASRTKDQRRIRIVGERLKAERYRMGLTQRQLAGRSGYTDRLIRKAESGGQLNRQSIADIVTALTEFGSSIRMSDLIFDPVSIARLFVDSYEQFDRQMIEHCDWVLASDLLFERVGDSSRWPIAGRFHGLAGLQTWLDTFFGTFTRRPNCSLNGAFFACENCVVARYFERVQYGLRIAPPIWVNLYLVIEDGLIVKIRNEYDTLTFSQFMHECGIGPLPSGD